MASLGKALTLVRGPDGWSQFRIGWSPLPGKSLSEFVTSNAILRLLKSLHLGLLCYVILFFCNMIISIIIEKSKDR